MPRKEALLKVRLTDELKAEAEAIATAQGESLSVIIRQALRQYIDRWRVDTQPREVNSRTSYDSVPRIPSLVNDVDPTFPDAGTATSGQPSPGDRESKSA